MGFKVIAYRALIVFYITPSSSYCHSKKTDYKTCPLGLSIKQGILDVTPEKYIFKSNPTSHIHVQKLTEIL